MNCPDCHAKGAIEILGDLDSVSCLECDLLLPLVPSNRFPDHYRTPEKDFRPDIRTVYKITDSEQKTIDAGLAELERLRLGLSPKLGIEDLVVILGYLAIVVCACLWVLLT